MDIAAIIAAGLTVFGLGLLLGRITVNPSAGTCVECGWKRTNEHLVCRGCADRQIRTMSQLLYETRADRDRKLACLVAALRANNLLVEADWLNSPGKPTVN